MLLMKGLVLVLREHVPLCVLTFSLQSANVALHEGKRPCIQSNNYLCFYCKDY